MAEIKYNLEVTLNAPEGVNAIFIKIAIDPPQGGCIIYGYNDAGNIQPVAIYGSADRVDLPFSNPKIYIQYGEGVVAVQLWTLGFRDERGLPKPSAH